jgi:hypothetical protein
MEVNFHAFPGGKQYAYIQKPGSNIPIFVRNVIFLTPEDNARTIAIVCEWGAKHTAPGVWEPPKGQMEWKELDVSPRTVLSPRRIQSYMRKGVLREMMEEAKVHPDEIRGLTMMPLQYIQAWPEAGVPNAKFMYQFWHATLAPKYMLEAQKRIQAIVDDPALAAKLPPDAREKNGIRWWNPKHGDAWSQIRGAFSKKMTRMYYSYLDMYGIS